MSWEGYYQCICAKGHYFCSPDDYGLYDNEAALCTCGSEAVFSNQVDETNCESVGEIPHEMIRSLQVAEAVLETCPHCGHTKELEPAHYRVPTEEELKHMRHWRPGYGGTSLVPIEEYPR